MGYKQGDVVFVTMETPSGHPMRHPFLILSCRAANSQENYYTAVMLTSKIHNDRFSFPLLDQMFESPVNKHAGEIRLYIIVSFSGTKIESFCNRMKIGHFRKVLEEIKDFVLCVDS